MQYYTILHNKMLCGAKLCALIDYFVLLNVLFSSSIIICYLKKFQFLFLLNTLKGIIPHIGAFLDDIMSGKVSVILDLSHYITSHSATLHRTVYYMY